jgi:hypothetical protein
VAKQRIGLETMSIISKVSRRGMLALKQGIKLLQGCFRIKNTILFPNFKPFSIPLIIMEDKDL